MTPGDVCVQRKGRPPSRAIAGNPANYDAFPEENLMVTPCPFESLAETVAEAAFAANGFPEQHLKVTSKAANAADEPSDSQDSGQKESRICEAFAQGDMFNLKDYIGVGALDSHDLMNFQDFDPSEAEAGDHLHMSWADIWKRESERSKPTAYALDFDDASATAYFLDFDNAGGEFGPISRGASLGRVPASRLMREEDPKLAGSDEANAVGGQGFLRSSRKREDVEEISGLLGTGQWRRLKGGITMDSGCSLDTTPVTHAPNVQLGPIPECRQGRIINAANGTRIKEHGTKRLQFRTKDGQSQEWNMVATDVKKALKSVATT